jgi:hypothetical protein
MDGQKINLKFHRDILAEREACDPNLPSFLDIRTCGLHVMHGAFRTAFESTLWKLDSILKSLWYLFNESPTRRTDFQEITGSNLFPLEFCGTRWVEDRSVAERAIKCWSNVCKYVRKVTERPKSKIPKCASFQTIPAAVEDPLTVAKLHMFVNVASILALFLNHFQSERPLIPFLAQHVSDIIQSFLNNFIKKQYVSDNMSVVSLQFRSRRPKENYNL